MSNPTISGTKAVRKTLTAKRDTVTKPKASSVTYQWPRNGAKISKATGIDWRREAAYFALFYQDVPGTKAGLIAFLMADEFTLEEATYVADRCQF